MFICYILKCLIWQQGVGRSKFMAQALTLCLYPIRRVINCAGSRRCNCASHIHGSASDCSCSCNGSIPNNLTGCYHSFSCGNCNSSSCFTSFNHTSTNSNSSLDYASTNNLGCCYYSGAYRFGALDNTCPDGFCTLDDTRSHSLCSLHNPGSKQTNNFSNRAEAPRASIATPIFRVFLWSFFSDTERGTA